MNDKKIIIVDKEDTFVGKETYIKIHDEKILHRSTKVLIFNENGERVGFRKQIIQPNFNGIHWGIPVESVLENKSGQYTLVFTGGDKRFRRQIQIEGDLEVEKGVAFENAPRTLEGITEIAGLRIGDLESTKTGLFLDGKRHNCDIPYVSIGERNIVLGSTADKDSPSVRFLDGRKFGFDVEEGDRGLKAVSVNKE